MPPTSFTTNIVEKYLKENIGKNLSLRKMHKDLKLSRKTILLLIKHSENISPVKPFEVGSNAFFLHVYTYVIKKNISK